MAVEIAFYCQMPHWQLWLTYFCRLWLSVPRGTELVDELSWASKNTHSHEKLHVLRIWIPSIFLSSGAYSQSRFWFGNLHVMLMVLVKWAIDLNWFHCLYLADGLMYQAYWWISLTLVKGWHPLLITCFSPDVMNEEMHMYDFLDIPFPCAMLLFQVRIIMPDIRVVTALCPFSQ